LRYRIREAAQIIGHISKVWGHTGATVMLLQVGQNIASLTSFTCYYRL
jgi:hypothetical protein